MDQDRNHRTASLPGTRPAGTTDEATAGRQVREMFSGIAPRYDLLNHVLSMRFDVLWRRRLARRFRDLLAQPEARVLDLCCGTGDLALALAAESVRGANRKGASVWGADFAHPMLQRAREKSSDKAAGAPRCAKIEYLEADALALPFAAESFDLVTAAFGFRNLANYRSGLVEIRRVLRPGGYVAILEFSEPPGPLFGALYRLYFRHVLPRLGGLISGNGQAYGYLPNSVARFPSPAELAALMAEVDFRTVDFRLWTGGIVASHTARR